MQGEEPVDGPKTLWDSLGIIHAVHANQQELIAQAQAMSSPTLILFRVERSVGGRQIGIDANRLRSHVGGLAAARHRKTLHVYLRFKRAVDGVQEIIAMILNVER